MIFDPSVAYVTIVPRRWLASEFPCDSSVVLHDRDGTFATEAEVAEYLGELDIEIEYCCRQDTRHGIC